MSLSAQTDRRNAPTKPLVRLLYGLDLHNIANQHFTVPASEKSRSISTTIRRCAIRKPTVRNAMNTCESTYMAIPRIRRNTISTRWCLKRQSWYVAAVRSWWQTVSSASLTIPNSGRTSSFTLKVFARNAMKSGKLHSYASVNSPVANVLSEIWRLTSAHVSESIFSRRSNWNARTKTASRSASDTRCDYENRIEQLDRWYEGPEAIAFGQFYHENILK